MANITFDGTRVFIDGVEHRELQIRTAPGSLDRLAQWARYHNWKTSLFGVISAIAGFVVANPGDFAPWPVVGHIAGYVMAGGLLSMGLSAKDGNKGSMIPLTELKSAIQQTPQIPTQITSPVIPSATALSSPITPPEHP